MASEKAKDLANAVMGPVGPEEMVQRIDTAVAPLLDALKEWYDAQTSTDVSNDWDSYAFEAKIEALLRAWGRK